MMSLPVVFLIVISSNYRNGNGPGAVQLLPAKDANPHGNREAELKEAHPSEMSSRANDLGLADLKLLVPDSTTRKIDLNEPEVTEEAPIRKQNPMPLYSLVKNVCEEGYIMDQNGVCQKAAVLKGGGKKFDSERKRRRRKRYVEDSEMLGKKNLKPFFEHLNAVARYQKLLEKFKGNEKIDCGKIYPGLVADGAGGCKKSDFSDGSDKLRFLPKWKLSEGSTSGCMVL